MIADSSKQTAATTSNPNKENLFGGNQDFKRKIRRHPRAFQHGAELIARQIGSNDAASAASAASYRYKARVRELHARFENELQAVRDAYLHELAGLELTDE